ncbi:MAG: hypothetical protein ACR2JB_00010 [Bryobacteraceae bacterium]
MMPNRPCRNPNEVWPEIAEALEGLNDNQYALAVALEGTLKGARRALRERSAGCEDLNAEAGHIVREIFPHDELAEAERIFGQRPVAAKSGKYRRIHGHFIEELFDKPLEDLASGEEGVLVPTKSFQLLPSEARHEEERYIERGNRLAVQAVAWDLPYGIFERSVPETFPYDVRFALRWRSPERTQFLKDLYSSLEVEILAIERDRRMVSSQAFTCMATVADSPNISSSCSANAIDLTAAAVSLKISVKHVKDAIGTGVLLCDESTQDLRILLNSVLEMQEEIGRRLALFDKYRSKTGQPSKRAIYNADNCPIHKPELYDWLYGILPRDSIITINFERFLGEMKPPIRFKQ